MKQIFRIRTGGRIYCSGNKGAGIISRQTVILRYTFKAVHITAELTRFCSFTSMQPLESTHCACIGERDISANKHCWPSAAHHSYQACGIALHSNTGSTSGSVQMCTPAEIKHRRLCKGHLAWGLALAWLLQELGLVYVPAGASTMLCIPWTCCPFCNVCFGHDSLQ